MNCPNCNAKISKDASFCLKCGVKLYEEEEEEEEVVEKPRGKAQYPPYQYAPPQPFLAMKTVMLFVVIGVILVLVGASWIAIARNYDYDKYNEVDNAGLLTPKAKDYRKEVAKSQINSISYGSLLMVLGFFIAGIFLFFGGMLIKDLKDYMKIAMIISSAIMIIGISQTIVIFFYMGI